MDPLPRLRDAIDHLYRVFAASPRPSRIDASPEVDRRVLEKIVATDLREIADDAIGSYAGSALWTAGTVDDFRYFLPRILEQSVRHPVWLGTEPVVVAGKLKAAEWHSWPVEEKQAVERLFLDAWAQVCSTSPDEEDAGGWLLGLARLGSDLTDPLADWLAADDPNATAQLASVVFDLRAALSDKEHFWAEVDSEPRRVLFDWLTSDPVETALIEGSAGVAEQHRWMIDAAVDAIAEWKSDGFR